jgi:toxin ParE1/3/4
LKRFEVLLTEDAVRDLEELVAFLEATDCAAAADRVLERIDALVTSLSENPERGVVVGELAALGVREYRELFFKPYRLIYRVFEARVVVFLVVDGRRDMRTLLQERLLR